MPLQNMLDGDGISLQEAFNRTKIQIGSLSVPTGMEKAFRSLLSLLDQLEVPVETPPEESWEEEEERTENLTTDV
jgi:hypothetical protein